MARNEQKSQQQEVAEKLESILAKYPEYAKYLLPQVFDVEKEFLNIKSLSRQQNEDIQRRIIQLVRAMVGK